MCSVPPKTRKQIASEYGMSESTLRRRFNRIDLAIPRGDILPAHQKLIYESMGYPSDVDRTCYETISLPTPPPEKADPATHS